MCVGKPALQGAYKFSEDNKKEGEFCVQKVGDTRSTNEYNSILSFKMQMYFVTERKNTPFPNVVKCRPYLQYPLSISPANEKKGLWVGSRDTQG